MACYFFLSKIKRASILNNNFIKFNALDVFGIKFVLFVLIDSSHRIYSKFLTFVIWSDESKYVFVPEHDRLVDLALPEPGLLVAAVEDLHGHVLAAPVTEHHFSKTENQKIRKSLKFRFLLEPCVSTLFNWVSSLHFFR